MFFGIFFGVIVLDQISKYIAYTFLQPQNTIPVIDNFFYLTYLESNSDTLLASRDNIWFIMVVTVIIILIALFYGFKKNGISDSQKIGIALICSGAVSNLIDRMRHGFIIDFFDFEIWPIFNIADLSAVIGGIILIYIVLFQNKHKVT